MGEVEVVIFSVVFNKLLKGARTIRACFAQDGERHKAKTQGLTDEISRHFAVSERVFRKIPEGLFAALGLIYGRIRFALMGNFNQECIVRAERELTSEFKVTMLKGLF